MITCERCGRTTTDPDRWDPELHTGRIFCDECWPHRADDQREVPVVPVETRNDVEPLFDTLPAPASAQRPTEAELRRLAHMIAEDDS